MYVCLCNGVTESDVDAAIAGGASTLEEVAYCTGAGTKCGTCRSVVASLIDRSEDERPCRARLRVLTSAA